MPRTYEPIASTTLGSNTTSVTLSGIPSTFTDLRLIAVARGTFASTTITGHLRFNGEAISSTKYSATLLSGNGSAASSVRVVSTVMQFGEMYAANAASGEWTVVSADIMSYASTAVNKTALFTVSTPGYFVHRSVGLWRDTAAITSVVFSANGGDIASGSTFSLFGIKAA